MTRRNGEITRSDLQHEWPYHVALAAEKLRDLKNGVIVRRFANTLSVSPLTYSLRRDDSDYMVFRFAKPEDADTFCERFGGEQLSGRQQQ